MSAAIRYLDPIEDWANIKTHIDVIPCYDTCGLLCENPETKEFYGAVLFDQMTVTSAQCHLCLPSPIMALRAGLMEAAAVFIFWHLNKNMIYGLTPSKNAKALKFNKHFGFREVCRLEGAYAVDEDAIVFEMKKQHCRWLPAHTEVVDDVYTLSEVRHCG